MNHKITGILLIFCLVVPIGTTYLFLKFQKKQLKREVKWKMIAGIDKEELVLIKLTKEASQTQLRWEHSKEFEYKNQMYDIVEKKIKGDTIYYWCWWDHEETALNKKLENLVSWLLGNEPQRKDKQNNLIDFFKKLFTATHTIQFTATKSLKVQYLVYNEDLISFDIIPPVPPPRLL